MTNTKKLYRSNTNSIIFGVCGGLGEYFEVDPLIFRILFILLTFTGGSGIIIYLILAIMIPDSEGKINKNMGEVVSGTQEKTQQLAEEIKKNRNWIVNIKNIIGLIIIFVGLDILFEQIFDFNPFSIVNWGIVWALIIILIGLRIIFNRKE
ncbi:MAG TPA: PspC domain-containing protein [Candidatus Pacearchaeota archaeon]|nr:PspC domain-containing protein [Candidatus Pacearchaeota archaeon]HPR79959.1 PspC domain-containing protein [Candidatus Pacearchaeota archaeon]